MRLGLLVLTFVAVGLAALSAEGRTLRRDLLAVNEDDGSFGFNSDLDENVSLRSNSTRLFCFLHRVSCVEFSFRAVDTGTGQPVTILGFVVPKKEGLEAQEMRQISGNSILKGSVCATDNCNPPVSVDADSDEELCIMLVNGDFEFDGTTEIEDFQQSGSSNVVAMLSIEGCPTVTQRIVAIVVPVAVFVGVAACFSAWWVRRRRKEFIAKGTRDLPMAAFPPTGQQVLPTGQPGVNFPPRVVNFQPVYSPAAVTSPRDGIVSPRATEPLRPTLSAGGLDSQAGYMPAGLSSPRSQIVRYASTGETIEKQTGAPAG